MVMCVVAAACLGNVSIVKESGTGESGHKLTHGSYLLFLLRGNKDATPGMEEKAIQEPTK